MELPDNKMTQIVFNNQKYQVYIIRNTRRSIDGKFSRGNTIEKKSNICWIEFAVVHPQNKG